MTNEELRVLRLIQATLVRNYIDTQKLEVQVIGTSVYIEGELKVFDYHPSQKKVDPVERNLGVRRTLQHIEQQIRGLAEVSYLEMKLTNWERTGTQWNPRAERPTPGHTPTHASGTAPPESSG